MGRPLRRSAIVGALLLPAFSLITTSIDAPPASAATVPAGFTDTPVASVNDPTTIVPISNGRAVVLDQNGSVRILNGDTLVPTPALTLSVCGGGGSERGLLGFATDRDFNGAGNVFVYYTHSVTGGCVNRVSRFFMNGDTIDAGSETILLDNIASNNHNGGDLEVGNDGFLYVAIGDAGTDPRGDSGAGGANDAAQDGSILNGKIVRITTDGQPAPGNPFSGPTTARCATRGATASTPVNACQEIFAYGLRNPYRFAFDTNTGATRFFINDVGQSTREEVNEGILGANYGWNAREGQCPRGSSPPCAGPPPGVTDPLTDYPRSIGTFITAGAFVPNGIWPAEYDGGYLFADGGSGKIFLRKADGSVDYDAPFATDVQGIADMAFVPGSGGYSLVYVLSGSGAVRRIDLASNAPTPPIAGLELDSVTPKRVYDTRLDIGVAPGIMRANSTRMIDVQVPDPSVKAVLVNISLDQTAAAGYVQAWSAQSMRPATAVINAEAAAQVVSNTAVLPVNDGKVVIYVQASTHVIVDVLGYYSQSGGATADGRFVALPPIRRADTREGPGSTLPGGQTNAFTVVGDHIDVAFPGTSGIPNDGTVEAVAFILAAVSSPTDVPGHVTAYPAGAARPNAANVTASGRSDARPNLVIVPLGTDGKVSIHRVAVSDVTVDVAGYVTGPSSPASTAGLFTILGSQRVVDTREPIGFGPLDAGETDALVVGTPDATAVLQNLAFTDTTGPGYYTSAPDDGTPLPFVSNGNTSGPGQIRAAFSITKVGPNGRVRYFAQAATQLVVDVYGYVT
ncbi:MAG: sorbosone dehydrogenase family protein [Acidimicrobiia bacterium]